MNMNAYLPSYINKVPTLTKLYSEQGKKIDHGKILLLGRAITDKIYLGSVNFNYNDRYSVKLFVNTHLPHIREVISALSAIYIFDDSVEAEIIEVIVSLVQWKLSLLDTNNALQCVFTGDKDTVLDEFTSVTRFVEPIHICGMVDMAERATFFYSTYRKIVDEVFAYAFSPVKE